MYFNPFAAYTEAVKAVYVYVKKPLKNQKNLFLKTLAALQI